MLKKIFHWQYSGAMIPFLYGTGLAFWGLAVATDPYIPLFCAASLFFFCGFLWSLGWGWTDDFFSKEEQPHGRRKKFQHQLNTRRQRNILFLSTFLFFIPFAAVEGWLWTSYKAHAATKELGHVEIFFGDNQMMKGMEVPFGDLDHSAFDKALRSILSQMPTIVMYSSDPIEKPIAVSVIVKNTSDVPIRNATVTIHADKPFSPKTYGFVKFSDTEYSYQVREMRPFARLSEMHYFSAQADEGIYSFLITVDGDNMKPYSAVGRVRFIIKQQP